MLYKMTKEIEKDKRTIIEYYENCLASHGPNHKGVNWPNQADAETRYRVMLDIKRFDITNRSNHFSVIDYGCGVGGMLEHIKNFEYNSVVYYGFDESKKMLSFCSGKYGSAYFDPKTVFESRRDYVLMNGLFTVKASLTFPRMWDLMTCELHNSWQHSSKGIAFNVMSTNVDYRRKDLFHCPIDMLSEWICKNLSRNFIIRNDYGLYEYTVYVYKNNKPCKD